MKKYHLRNIIVVGAKFYQSSATCYRNQLTAQCVESFFSINSHFYDYSENVRKCQQRTNTTGSIFVITFTTRYSVGCNTTSCHQQYLSNIYTNIETIYHRISLPITFTNGRTIDIELMFCSFGLGDTG